MTPHAPWTYVILVAAVIALAVIVAGVARGWGK